MASTDRTLVIFYGTVSGVCAVMTLMLEAAKYYVRATRHSVEPHPEIEAGGVVEMEEVGDNRAVDEDDGRPVDEEERQLERLATS